MQALILVGGEGTRLRPLTLKRPKPVLPLVGQPFISYMLEWLRAHGVDDVVMACGFEPDALRETIGSGDAEQRVSYVVEPDPRGTAGAIRFAEEHLHERFFVLQKPEVRGLHTSLVPPPVVEALAARGSLGVPAARPAD